MTLRKAKFAALTILVGVFALLAACPGSALAAHLIVTLTDGSQVTYNIPVDESNVQSVALGSSQQSMTDAEAAIATVNGQPITRQDFYIALSEAAGRPVLDQLISEMLLAQAATEAGVSVSNEEVDREFESVRQQVGPEFESLLAQYGMTADDLRKNIKISLLVFRVSTKDVVVTDEQIAAYYNEHTADFESPEMVKASHILVETEADAQAALDRISAGADFADVAAAVSMDPMTAQNGGDLGFFAAGEMVPEFGDAAFALKTGEISGIVKTDYGYHIIQVTDRVEPRRASFEEASGVIERLLRSAHAMKPADLIAQLKETSLITVFDSRFTDLGTIPLP
ncbi:MAG TPA: peptidylprolyl isomerase [Bacillota bacterium]|nr:peptidylprolyl isomerase [Bacillota bacterium]